MPIAVQAIFGAAAVVLALATTTAAGPAEKKGYTARLQETMARERAWVAGEFSRQIGTEKPGTLCPQPTLAERNACRLRVFELALDKKKLEKDAAVMAAVFALRKAIDDDDKRSRPSGQAALSAQAALDVTEIELLAFERLRRSHDNMHVMENPPSAPEAFLEEITSKIYEATANHTLLTRLAARMSAEIAAAKAAVESGSSLEAAERYARMNIRVQERRKLKFVYAKLQGLFRQGNKIFCMNGKQEYCTGTESLIEKWRGSPQKAELIGEDAPAPAAPVVAVQPTVPASAPVAEAEPAPAQVAAPVLTPVASAPANDGARRPATDQPTTQAECDNALTEEEIGTACGALVREAKAAGDKARIKKYARRACQDGGDIDSCKAAVAAEVESKNFLGALNISDSACRKGGDHFCELSRKIRRSSGRPEK